MKKFYYYFQIILMLFYVESFGQAVTLTTEVLPVSNIYPGEDVLIHTVKLTSTSGSSNWQNITFSTSGSYTASDVNLFKLYVSTTNSFGSAVPLTSGASTGSGEFLTFSAVTAGFNPLNPITATSTTPDRYYFLVANLKPSATVGNTININALVNPAILTFTTATAITNSQTNVSGVQTIGTRVIATSTEALPAEIAYPGESKLMYTLKITSLGGTHKLTSLAIPFSGTATISDVESVKITVNTVNNVVTANNLSVINTFSIYNPGFFNFIFYASSIGIPLEIPNNSSKYIFITVKFKSTVATGSTFKIDGSSAPATFTTIISPTTVVPGQTDVAGVKTIAQPNLVLSTESLSASSVYKNQKPILYKLKIDSGTGFAILNSLTLKTRGTYSATDLSYFQIAYGTTTAITSYSGAVAIRTAATVPNVESVSFTGLNYTVLGGTPAYIYIVGGISSTATVGNIIKVNGSADPLITTYTTAGAITNNLQSDAAGNRTIATSNVTYTAQAVPTTNINKGQLKNVLYKAKISSPDGVVNLNSISFLTSGSYLTGDFTSFKLSITSTDDINAINTTSSVYNLHFAPTSNGETITFTNTLGSFFANTNMITGDKYLWIIADVSPTATPGRTIKINALSNPTALTFFETPNVTNTLADIAGTQTIAELPITLSTVATPTANVFQGEIGSPMYILKVDSPTSPSQIASMNIATVGTYVAADMSSFALYYNVTNNPSTATFVQSNWYSGASPNLSFYTFSTPITIPAGQSGYFFVLPSVKNTAIAGHTMKINGSSNPISLVLANGTPTITNNQTDVAGTRTIVAATTVATPSLTASSLTYCSGNSPAGVTLTAASCPSSSQAVWFLGGSSVAFASTNGTLLVTPTVPTTYTVSCMGSGINSGMSASVTITPVLINQPTSLTASPTFSPSAGSPVVLTATGCGTQTVVWENLSTTNPRTVTPSVDKVYSFRCSNGPCTSTGEMSYALTIGPCLLTHTLGSPTDDVSTGVFTKIASANISGKVTATNKITGTAKSSYTARVIELQPGFLADTGTLFLANTGGCF